MKLHDGHAMEYGGIAHRLKDNSVFLCLAKMLVAVIRTTILVEPFGLAYLQLKRMPRRMRSCWWRVCHERTR